MRLNRHRAPYEVVEWCNHWRVMRFDDGAVMYRKAIVRLTDGTLSARYIKD